MNTHSCLLCLGSNFERELRMDNARKALAKLFPGILFSAEMETEAIGGGVRSPFSNQVAKLETCHSLEQLRSLLKSIEAVNGRCPEDKEQGIVRLDIDILVYDKEILKPADLERDYVQEGLKALK